MFTLNTSSANAATVMSATKSEVEPADAELWHAYLRAISDYFPFSDKSNGSRIYTAPLTSFGVTIGMAINPVTLNNDVFRLGDLMLPPDSPLFVPRLSYSQRLRRYLQAVSISPGRQDPTTLARLQKARKQLDQATKDFIKCRREAYDSYLSDPVHGQPPTGATITEAETLFDSWVKTFYPAYQLASIRMDATSQEAYDASLDYYGPQAATLWKDKAQLDQAFQPNVANAPYNMPTSTAQVTEEEVVGTVAATPLPGPDIVYRPRYNIDARFSEQALNWVINAHNGKNKPLKITFHSTSHAKLANRPSNWKDLGFSRVSLDKHDEVAPLVPLFTAQTHETPKSTERPTYQVGVGGESTSVTVEITGSDAAVFSISPDQSWDIPDITTKYPKLQADAPKDLFQPLVLVTHVFLGYQVAISMTLDKSTFEQIDKGIGKCQKYGGTASLFGLSLGPRSTDSMVGFEQIERDPTVNRITIPPRDNAQLTLIGLMGMELAALKPK
ncbi:hypothetical protein Forpe1208_v011804 [Fusarium oxysporum f. sp. rapae]|uniref:Uncharacterized protein n=1 Tax=Fusarium oxysporum f. sp. rapae TaxID=485398 RepID=A0A8J5P0B2_FUSOX|nr:hypothetical protein Forpe1208_v011804 [Fusarium oxysporum f. sp. rapae]